MQRPLLDPEIESKLRALALARRRLSREIKRLNAIAEGKPSDARLGEIDRLVLLARWILDTNKSSIGPEVGAPAAPARRAPAIPLVEEKPPTPQHELVMHGQTHWFHAPDLIAYLGSVRKTGVLRITAASEIFTIEFSVGDIVHCESTRPSPGQRLGDILISQGALTRSSLESHLASPSEERLGARLLRSGVITEGQLDAALRTQVQVLFCHLCREETKSFRFWTGPPLFPTGGIKMSAISLLLEGARVNDEFADRLGWLEDRH